MREESGWLAGAWARASTALPGSHNSRAATPLSWANDLTGGCGVIASARPLPDSCSRPTPTLGRRTSAPASPVGLGGEDVALGIGGDAVHREPLPRLPPTVA